jgi:hypothetical protein
MSNFAVSFHSIHLRHYYSLDFVCMLMCHQYVKHHDNDVRVLFAKLFLRTSHVPFLSLLMLINLFYSI